MKRFFRYGIIFLLLWFSFRQAVMIGALAPSVSLRFDTPFSLEQMQPFAAAWAEERTFVAGYEATLLRFAGDAQLVYPARWLHGSPPNDIMEKACAVSSQLAWLLYGGEDVTGLPAGEYTVCGVFDSGEAVLMVPDVAGFLAAELHPVPAGVDGYRHAQDAAAQAGLEEPSQILCGPEAGFWAGLLPWLGVLIAAWPLLRKWPALGWIAGLAVIFLLPEWFVPTRWSDRVFWSELGQSLSGRTEAWLSVNPAVRDIAVKEAWFRLLLGIAGIATAVRPLAKCLPGHHR